MTMRVLDIDLDFFLADCCPLAPAGERPALAGHEPWEESKVTAFLEEQCGLSARFPLPGAIFETHDEALVFWQARIRDGSLRVPFRVTHVDAHSDLGIGKPGPGFVLSSVLARRPDKRADPDNYYKMRQLDEANYLLFALAFRWISELDNVRNPRSRPDIPAAILAEGRSDLIRLSSFVSRLMESANGAEPQVPFHVYDDYSAFRADGKFDFITVAISPRYAPREADALLKVFERYIDVNQPPRARDMAVSLTARRRCVILRPLRE